VCGESEEAEKYNIGNNEADGEAILAARK